MSGAEALRLPPMQRLRLAAFAVLAIWAAGGCATRATVGPTAAAAKTAPSAASTESESAGAGSAPAAASAGPAEEQGSPPRCGAEALAAAAAADARLREISVCDPDELARLAAGVRALEGCANGETFAPAARWVFPVGGVRIGYSIGGRGGSGFRRARNLPCYAVAYPGHPAHDLFVPDRSKTSPPRDSSGNPFFARAVETAFVLVAHDGWTSGDAGKGGNYVMLYLPARRQIAYYAHLETVLVKAGDRLAPGQALGTVGRTGRNAFARRSPTHLHFGLWDADGFRPVNSYAWLKAADDLAPTLPAPTAR